MQHEYIITANDINLDKVEYDFRFNELTKTISVSYKLRTFEFPIENISELFCNMFYGEGEDVLKLIIGYTNGNYITFVYDNTNDINYLYAMNLYKKIRLIHKKIIGLDSMKEDYNKFIGEQNQKMKEQNQKNEEMLEQTKKFIEERDKKIQQIRQSLNRSNSIIVSFLREYNKNKLAKTLTYLQPTTFFM
jgi:hypothetical protein